MTTKKFWFYAFALVGATIMLFGSCEKEDENTKPVANAGEAQIVNVGDTVELDGSESSDDDGDSLTYSWSITSAPDGSTAALSDSGIVNPTFIPDVVGDYSIQLIVNDGTENSDADTVSVSVDEDNGLDFDPIFVFQRDWDIFVMDIDGNKFANLTNTPEEENYPSWSPDGNQIAFVSSRDGNYEIYVMNHAGENISRLTNNQFSDTHPLWSPNGNKILFNREEENIWNLYVMDSDGMNQQKITLTDLDDQVTNACWSPDGSRVLYTRNLESLNIARIDGTEDIAIYTGSITHGCHWSPDGSSLAFTNDGVYTMDASGENIQNLSNIRWDYYPFFSPDGRKILFQVHTEENSYDLYVMDSNGENKLLIANTMGWRLDAQNWSPDGEHIVYYKPNDDDTWSIYTVDTNGSNSVRLTYDHNDFTPRWRPQEGN
ncbi:MAG: DPP IV N-terminal domain-containing protein [Salinivirgaceae bacterium]|nr:DPP IV N-terminal domain-containing protein [Salinivirgaceae bacterium]